MSGSGIRDNRKNGSVGGYLKDNITPDSELMFLSAYFTVYAYGALKDQLNSIANMKFLFGEPTFIQQRNILDSRSFNIDKHDMAERENSTSDSISYGITLDDRLSQSAITKDCVKWIKEKVEIRSMLKEKFLHGKLYHITESNRREMSVMGSSNFTYNGLGFGDSKNIELNLITDSNNAISDMKGWFLELWNNKEFTIDVKKEVIEYLEQYYKENSPEFLYYFTLFHIFKDYLDENKSDIEFEEELGFGETKIWNMLYDFQKDAVKGAINKLKKYNGCIIADSVGLGKTFEALAVIKHYEKEGKDVLVLCPKRLGENWTIFTQHDDKNFLRDDKFRYEVLYHTDLNRSGKQGNINLNSFPWSKFDLIVIDESHNFRNNRYSKGMTRYEWLLEKVIKEGKKTQVLMLSATPVNNKLTDLTNQIHLATKGEDNALEKEGIKNIKYTLIEAQKIFNGWSKMSENTRKVDNLIEKLAATDFFKLLDILTIARSREQIKKHFNSDVADSFPERLKPYSVYADIDTQNNFISYKEINETFEKLNLAIFSPFAFIKDECKKKYQEKYDTKTKSGSVFTQEERESHLVGMMKINYLKRLESSINSFNLSIERLYKNIESTIKLFEVQSLTEEFEFDEEKYNSWTTPDDSEEEMFVGKKIKIAIRDLKENWKDRLYEDWKVLKDLYAKTCVIDIKRDNKILMLKKMIKEKVKYSSINGEKINEGNKKIIVFTAFSDTAEYIYSGIKDYCSHELGVQLGLVTGSGGCKTTFTPAGYNKCNDYNTILTNFSPVSKYRDTMSNMPQSREIDILIATDCISEGQNLQDCDCVVNYDIHWNPVKILQRFGRVDRISKAERRNKKVKLINFWATEDLNEYIKLNERIKAKMAIVDISATGDEGGIIAEKEAEKYSLTFREKQLLRMKDEILDIEQLYENVSLTEFNFNDFRMDILNYIKNNFKDFDKSPMGLYAICPCEKNVENEKHKFVMQPGVVFCLKRKTEDKSNRKSNPIEPYYLLYVHDNGDVKIGYANAKRILSAYRSLCLGKDKSFEDLSILFNEKTDNAKDMSMISRLILAAIENITSEAKKQSLMTLEFDRSLKVFNSENIKKSNDKYDLISFLVIL